MANKRRKKANAVNRWEAIGALAIIVAVVILMIIFRPSTQDTAADASGETEAVESVDSETEEETVAEAEEDAAAETETVTETAAVPGAVVYPTSWAKSTGLFLGDSNVVAAYLTGPFIAAYDSTIINLGISGAMATDYYGMNVPYYQVVEKQANECDYIVVLLGSNDWSRCVSLGAEGDTTASTFYGGFYRLLYAIRVKYPTTPVFVSTIIQRDYPVTQYYSYTTGVDDNGTGYSCEDFNEAIRYTSDLFNCVLVDSYNDSGIRVDNIEEYTSDRLHLNAEGGIAVGQLFVDAMNQKAAEAAGQAAR